MLVNVPVVPTTSTSSTASRLLEAILKEGEEQIRNWSLSPRDGRRLPSPTMGRPERAIKEAKVIYQRGENQRDFCHDEGHRGQ